MTRSISHSEASALLDCGLRWDLAYGGRIAGSALKPLITAPRLRDGRAWGRAVARLGECAGRIDALDEAMAALTMALEEDAREQRAAGNYSPDEHRETFARLADILRHHAASAPPLLRRDSEHQIDVPIPSRGGRRRSNRFRLLAMLDGLHDDEHGTWIVEDKLRSSLSDLTQVSLGRQIRWYAWAYREATGTEAVGVIVSERLNEVPRPAKVNKDGRPSIDKAQRTTPELYRAACETAGVEPDPETLEHFATRRWQARHRVFLRPDEIDEAGEQLVSVARQVALMETGDLYPVRNPSPMRCPGCPFLEICPNPRDAALVDALYTRQPAKRDRDHAITPERIAA